MYTKKFGVNLTHSATAQSKNGTYVAKENLQPGDLVFLKITKQWLESDIVAFI